MSDWYHMWCGIHQGGILSLIKYTAFINALIVELEESGLCCKIYGISSTPPGYADDLATACLSKPRMDRVMELVYRYGNKWRFEFNTKKSAIMFFGENKRDNERNSENRVFMMGEGRVKERQSYDHVGVKSCLFRNDESRVMEKISKGRKVLNASTGLGIRKSGLNMATCNLIFWTIIIPIVTFGSEIWPISDADYENLALFQRYAGRRLQRLPNRTPTGCSYYAMGWMRISTYILVKKLLFAMSILRLDVENVVRKVFLARFMYMIDDNFNMDGDIREGPTAGIMRAAKRLGLLGFIKNFVNGVSGIPSKGAWSKVVWAKAWQLEDSFCNTMKYVYKETDLLNDIMCTTKYLIWWEMSDKRAEMTRISENMVKLVCHASRLKGDDYRLKGCTHSLIACSECDMFIKEDLKHLVLQCPCYEYIRRKMFNDLYVLDSGLENLFIEHPNKVFQWLIGMNIDGTDSDFMYKFLTITGEAIVKMYMMALRKRDGIG